MSSRAHHPADRAPGEFSSDELLAPGAGESGRVAVDEAVSREVVVPLGASAERAALSRDDDASDPDEEEVVPEPDSIDQALQQLGGVTSSGVSVSATESEPPGESGERAVIEAAEARLAALTPPALPVVPVPQSVLDTTPVQPGVEPTTGEPPTVRRSSRPPPLTPSAPVAAATAPRSPSQPPPERARMASSPDLSPERARMASSPDLLPERARMASSPDLLPERARMASSPELSPEELAASQSAFTAAAPPELSAEELASVASAPPSAPPGPWSSSEPAPAAKRPSFRPPWVDEVPDPVTPYEQRVSETVKVADLPPVEQSRGRVLANRYLAEEVAEHTACSISYRAYHLALDRAVTVRILLRGLACSDEACQEVRRVAAVASALEHPHVASTLDFGVLSDGWPFVVTESFQGNTLSAILSNEGKFVLRRVMHIGKQVALGLSAAHEKGIVHGLLGPDNVLVVDPGTSAEVAKIMGFGISKARGPVPGPPRSGVFGVPFYVSPEQAACKAIDARSDIYSLGVILYELMTGAPPFSDGDFAGVLCQHLDDDAPAPSTRLQAPGALAKALDAIIERCLRKEPEKRYQTAAEVADDLVRLEAAAARTKRRPMPEVQKPTTTIHSPHPKAEATGVPGAKVIVHDDVDDPVSPEAPEVAARRSSPSLTRSSPTAATGASSSPRDPGAPTSSPSSAAGSARSSESNPARPMAKPVRVRVDQATIKISAVDRDKLMLDRPNDGSWFGAMLGWLSSNWLVAAVRRFLATATRSGDDQR